MSAYEAVANNIAAKHKRILICIPPWQTGGNKPIGADVNPGKLA
jgi:hypothetical protein